MPNLCADRMRHVPMDLLKALGVSIGEELHLQPIRSIAFLFLRGLSILESIV